MKIPLLLMILVSSSASASDYCARLREQVAAGRKTNKPQLSDRDLKCLGFGETCAKLRQQVNNLRIAGGDTPDLDEADEGCLQGEISLGKFL